MAVNKNEEKKVDKKIPNNPNKKDSDNNNSYLGVLAGLLFIILALNVLFMSVFSGGKAITSSILTKEFVDGLKETTYATVETDTTFRCVSYTPIFDKEGGKQYEVRFKDMNSNLYFTSVVSASEIDEKGNIVEDAKYEGTISYLYAESAFVETTKDMEQKDKDKRIVSLLNGKSEYASFGKISGIDFMYGDGVVEYTYEKAAESLTDYVDGIVNPKTDEEQANKNKKLGAIPLL